MRLSQMLNNVSDGVSVKSQYHSYDLLVNGGYIYKVAPGLYAYLPLMVKVLQNISKIIRRKMDSLGFQECLILREIQQHINGPSISYGEIISSIGENLILEERLNFGSIFLYHMPTKRGEEIEAFGGLLQSREFITLDCYSFHKSRNSLIESFHGIVEGFSQILKESCATFNITELPQEESSSSICYSFTARISEEEEFEIGRAYQIYGEPSDEKGVVNSQMFVGCYTLGISLLSQILVEQNYDQYGIVWADSIAPYKVIILSDHDILKIERAEFLYSSLNNLGIPTLLDDRDESNEIKIQDAKSIGVPFLVLGEEILDSGVLLLKLLNRQGLMESIFNAESFPEQLKVLFEDNSDITGVL